MTFLLSIITGIIIMTIIFGIMFLFAQVFYFLAQLNYKYIPLFLITIIGFLLGILIYACIVTG